MSRERANRAMIPKEFRASLKIKPQHSYQLREMRLGNLL